MSALDLARWQFGITTVYHFIFVPLTIGLGPMVAIMQTAWVRTGKEHWLRLTKFFGSLFLINFAMGVVTGIVQEFQFGMNWSGYSIFVGDIFGAPLAMEALIAFFIESTFLGAWIFGWGRLSKGVHLATIWLAAIAVNLSAYFIIVANSFMQHPVGTKYNPTAGRAELDSIVDVLMNSTALAAFPHTVAASFVTAGTLVAGVSTWWIVKHHKAGNAAEAAVYRPALRMSLLVLVISGIAVFVTGDVQGQLLFKQQPMKMAAAEALCETQKGAEFSVLSVGNLQSNDCNDVTHLITVPGLTSFLSTHDFNSTITGVPDLQEEYLQKYGAASGVSDSAAFVPMLPVTYWSFRLMIGLGAGAAAVALLGLWYTRRGRSPTGQRFATFALWMIPTPYLANFAGWIFTEMGRQPWIVAPNPDLDPQANPVFLTTEKAVSGFVDTPTVALSLLVFTLLYGVLAVIWFVLMRRHAAEGAPQVPSDQTPTDDTDDEAPLAFAY